jgi:hypothetical protein
LGRVWWARRDSNPDALIEALEEMEKVLTGSAGSENDGPIKQALEPDPN